MHIDRIADTNTEHGAWHPAIEGPVTKRGAFAQPAFQFSGDKVDAHRLRSPLTDRRGNLGRLLRDVGFNNRLRRRPRSDKKPALHAGELMSWQTTKINIVARLGGGERNVGARALAGDPRRSGGCSLIAKYDVVFGTFSVKQGDLDDLPFSSREHWV